MKHLFGNVFGFGEPMKFVTGLILLLLGLIVLGDGQIGIQATPTSEVQWITAFAALPNWFGWLFIWFGFDSFFDGKLTKVIVDKLFTSIAKAVVGEERLKKLQTRLEGKDKTAKWIGKTYGSVLDEVAMERLALLSKLKVESPELFEYFQREVGDDARYRGITSEMIEKTVKYIETG